MIAPILKYLTDVEVFFFLEQKDFVFIPYFRK